MSQIQIEQIINDIIAGEIQKVIWILILFCIFAGVASFFGAYFRRKGENHATKEDFNNITNQLKETTKTTEEIKKEIAFAKTTYEKYLGKIIEYYANFFSHYRLCQQATNADQIRYANGTTKTTKDIFFDNINKIKDEYHRLEGFVRLLLPKEILETISLQIEQYNDFNLSLKNDLKKATIKEKFLTIDKTNVKLEAQLREFLRVEKFIK